MPQRFIRKNPHKKTVRPASRHMVLTDLNKNVETENKEIKEQ